MLDVTALLDAACIRLADPGVDGLSAMTEVIRGLRELRASCTPPEWLETIRRCDSHRVRELFLEDPYTRRAYEKPRGYAGDAVMLDHVYAGRPPEGTTIIGRKVFAGTTQTGNGRSVVQGARVLSLACGHVRETELSGAIRGGELDVLFAVDRDPESLAVIARERAHPCIEPIRESVGGILKRTTSFERLHLIYSLGLYDYLPDDVARRLMAVLFEMLVPGGTLVLANGRTTRGVDTWWRSWPGISSAAMKGPLPRVRRTFHPSGSPRRRPRRMPEATSHTSRSFERRRAPPSATE